MNSTPEITSTSPDAGVHTRPYFIHHFGDFANVDASDESVARELIRANLPISRGPSLAITVVFLGLAGALFAAYLAGFVGLLPYLAVQGFYFFILSQMCHEAIHGALHPSRAVNRVAGHVLGLLLLLSVRMTHRQHLLFHHAKDPRDDFMHAGDPVTFGSVPRGVLHAVLSCFGSAWRMRVESLRSAPDERPAVVALLAAAALVLFLWPSQAFWGWFVPMHIGIALFWLIGAWLPHTLFGIGREPRTPRWMPDWLLHVVTFYHEDHHLSPLYPGFQWPLLWAHRLRTMRRMTGRQLSFVSRELRICQPKIARSR